MDQQLLKNALLQALLRMVPFVPANELKAVIDAIRRSESDVEKDVDEAITAIRKSSELVSSLEKKLTERSELLNRLKLEHEKLSALSTITKEQTVALADALKDTLGASSKRERYISLAINIVAGVFVFVLGILFGPPITRLLGGIF